MTRRLALCLALLAVAACGMKGDPVAPKDAKREPPAEAPGIP
jgi:predicted small lipoprotein YifL